MVVEQVQYFQVDEVSDCVRQLCEFVVRKGESSDVLHCNCGGRKT